MKRCAIILFYGISWKNASNVMTNTKMKFAEYLSHYMTDKILIRFW